jgi:hypothetical protein
MSGSVLDRLALMKRLQAGLARLDDLPDAVADGLAAAVMLDRRGLQAVFDDGVARDRLSPAVGEAAPDFTLELIEAGGRRTGQLRRLSHHRGRPVALVFGSYT